MAELIVTPSCNCGHLKFMLHSGFRWTWPADCGVSITTAPSPVRRRCLSSPCPASCSFCPSSSTWAASFTRNKRNASSYTVSNQLNSPIVTLRDFLTGFWGVWGLCGREGEGLTDCDIGVWLGMAEGGGCFKVVIKHSGLASCKPLDHWRGWRIVFFLLWMMVVLKDQTEEHRNFDFTGYWEDGWGWAHWVHNMWLVMARDTLSLMQEPLVPVAMILCLEHLWETGSYITSPASLTNNIPSNISKTVTSPQQVFGFTRCFFLI